MVDMDMDDGRGEREERGVSASEEKSKKFL